MNIGLIIVAIVGGAAGILSSLYVIISAVAVIVFKVYRKFKYRISLYD